MPNTNVSFIVPLFNHVEHSKEMFDSLLCTIPQDLSYELILVDDASTDATSEWLKSLDNPNLIKISNSINLGYAKSNNVAIKQSKGDYLVLINNDLLFTQYWLEPMLEVLESQKLNAGIVGNVQYRIQDGAIDHAGVQLAPNGQFEHLQEFSDTELYAKCFATTGACLLIKRHDFFALGLFDEAYINGGEDIDLCLALKKAGKNIFVSYQSKIGHHVSLSRDRASIQNEINSRRVFNKWRPEIKTELAKSWANILRINDVNTIHRWIDGDLISSFTVSPQIASRVLAEHFLIREEARWDNIVDGVDLNDRLAMKCSAKGIRFIEGHECYLVAPEFELNVKDLHSAINFFVCGKRVDPERKENLAMMIIVNNIQFKRIELPQDPNINVGIVNPIFIAGIDNRFKISVHFIDPISKEILGDASQSIVLTHFVLNDLEIHKI